MSWIPVMPAMSTIISDAESEYSTQRNRLRAGGQFAEVAGPAPG